MFITTGTHRPGMLLNIDNEQNSSSQEQIVHNISSAKVEKSPLGSYFRNEKMYIKEIK